MSVKRLYFNLRVDLIWVGLILIRVGFFFFFLFGRLIFWIELLLNEYDMSFLSCY